jgi:hypothetical protein
MPLQNRVLPDQTIVALPARGTLTGNRGILHDEGQILRRLWTSKAWICCTLDWKGARRQPMTGRSWTELFFLDEAVALAAGHRPCATCRRSAYNAFRAAWTMAALPGTKAPEIDAHLHATRLTPQHTQRRHLASAETLPDATFILNPAPHLLHGPHAFPWTPAGYLTPQPRPTGPVQVMTPEPTVALLRAGYRALIHPSLHLHPGENAPPGGAAKLAAP